jgi:hypothetical protein
MTGAVRVKLNTIDAAIRNTISWIKDLIAPRRQILLKTSEDGFILARIVNSGFT